ncbi:MAG: hypothetical protein COA84_02355 [Robiginitomaculum sp.]|nr:MAG: hypothetical protein COA84_02355 [Robiginitomaculum sp.]
MKPMPSILAALALSILAGPVLSDEAGDVRPVAPDAEAVKAALAVTALTETTLPWNRAFTVRAESREQAQSAVSIRSPGVAIPATSKWGVTVNFDLKDTAFKKMDRMSAGAYFDISPRIRLGGSLSFSAPGDLRVSTPGDRVLPTALGENESAVRIESSIKF